jgi:hypothetical protein
MSISKRLRFEVFKRDGFRCAYCGKTPPQVTLEADHIIPKASGGKDVLDNLVSACFDCNRGKAHISLEKIPQSLIDNADVLKEKQAQMREYQKHLERIDAQYDALVNRIQDIFHISHKFDFTEKSRLSVRQFIETIGIEEAEKSMRIATNKFPDEPESTFRYFCGICVRRCKGIGSPIEEKGWK